MIEKLRHIRESQAFRIARGSTLAGILAVSGVTTTSEVPVNSASHREVAYCGQSLKTRHIEQGTEVEVYASAVIASGNVRTNYYAGGTDYFESVREYDHDPNTKTVVGYRKSNGDRGMWNILYDRPGTLRVLECNTTQNEFYSQLGKVVTQTEKRLDGRISDGRLPNDESKSVQVQIED